MSLSFETKSPNASHEPALDFNARMTVAGPDFTAKKVNKGAMGSGRRIGARCYRYFRSCLPGAAFHASTIAWLMLLPAKYGKSCAIFRQRSRTSLITEGGRV